MKQFQAQKHRGTEGFGVFDRECTRLVRATKQRKILGWLKNHPSKSLMFHHRYPTSTENVKNACHPFSTKNHFATNYVLVHNGHISNSRALKTEHEKLGIEYYSVQKDGRFNDSEALLWDVALYLEGKQTELKAYGNIAFICLAMPRDGRKPSKLHFARNTNPLNMLLDKSMIMLSSEGEGEAIKADKLYSYNYRSSKLDTKYLVVPGYVSSTPSTSSKSSEHLNWQYSTDGNGIPYLRKTIPELPATTPCSDEHLSGFRFTHATNENEGSIMDEYIEDEDDRLELVEKFLVLPDGEDFSYNSVMSPDCTELIFENNRGVVLNVQSQIASRFDTYLETADGHYLSALTLLKGDITTYQRMLLEDEENGCIEDEDLVLELDILNATKDTLTTSPYWVSAHSVDPAFQDWVTDGVKNYLAGAV